MTTKSPNPPAAESLSWWERISEASSQAATSKNALRYVLIAAVVIIGGFGVWSFIGKSTKARVDEASDLLGRALALVPDTLPKGQYGKLPFYTQSRNESGAFSYNRTGISLSSYHYWLENNELRGNRDSIGGAFQNPEAAAKYLAAVESMIVELGDNKSKFDGSDLAWLYDHSLQQLQWFAAINSTDFAKRKSFLNNQLETLSGMKSRYGSHPVLGMHPDANQPQKNLMELWEDAARAELDFLAKNPAPAKIEADATPVVSMTLENGSVIKLKFFSQTAPLTVQNFNANVLAGIYDGTAVHGVDKAKGTLTMGNPFSAKAPERKFIWNKGDAGYAVPGESTPLLLPKKGSVTMERKGLGSHPSNFVIWLKDPETPAVNETVFAEVVEGLDSLMPWLETEVHDEVGLDNRFLPKVRLGISKVVTEGAILHASDDSWQAKPKVPELPPESDAEKKFMEALKAKEEPKPTDAPSDAPAPGTEGNK